MRKKIILIVVISVILTFIIYNLFRNEKINIVALGDSVAKGIGPNGEKSYSYNDYLKEYFEKNKKLGEFYNEFIKEDYRTTDIINLIKNNAETIHNDKIITIQQALVKADYITISIGNIDLFTHLGISNNGELPTNEELNQYFKSIFNDLNELLKLINQYTVGKVIVVGFYSPIELPNENITKIFEYLDEIYKKIVYENENYFISIHNEISGNSNYFDNSVNKYFNYKAHKKISDNIIRTLKL